MRSAGLVDVALNGCAGGGGGIGIAARPIRAQHHLRAERAQQGQDLLDADCDRITFDARLPDAQHGAELHLVEPARLGRALRRPSCRGFKAGIRRVSVDRFGVWAGLPRDEDELTRFRVGA